MSSMLAERSSATPLLGSQRPRLFSAPASALSEGDRVADLAARAGLVLDDWQRFVLDQGLRRRDDGMWAAFEVALIVSRQNGKGSILEALELAALFLDDFGVNLILHSAHEFKTAAEAFLRIRSLVADNPLFERRVARIRTGVGSEAIELKNGKRLRFIARSKGSGRGFTSDLVILDEAYNLGSDQMAALLPTLSTRPNPQVWYTSTAGMETSTQLARVRERGLRGGDPSLAFMEWSVDENDFDPADPAAHAMANPSMNIRGHGISSEYIERERAALDSDAFARERLGVGMYPVDPSDAWLVISRRAWEARAFPDAARPRPRPAIAADASPGQLTAAIAVSGVLPDGQILVEIPEGDHRRGVGWVVPRLKQLQRKYRPCAIVIDPAGPAAGLIDDAVKAGLEVTKPTPGESAQAFAQFTTGIAPEEGDPTITHLGQPELAKAVAGSATRDSGDGGKLWARRDTSIDISPLVAVTLAHWAFGKFGRNYDLLKSIGPPT